MSKQLIPTLSTQDQTTDFLLYTAPNGEIKVEVLLSNETIWLTQERMAELFGVQRPAITKHLKNIFETGELDERGSCKTPTPQRLTACGRDVLSANHPTARRGRA